MVMVEKQGHASSLAQEGDDPDFTIAFVGGNLQPDGGMHPPNPSLG
jgi:hypothetical protein